MNDKTNLGNSTVEERVDEELPRFLTEVGGNYYYRFCSITPHNVDQIVKRSPYPEDKVLADIAYGSTVLTPEVLKEGLEFYREHITVTTERQSSLEEFN